MIKRIVHSSLFCFFTLGSICAHAHWSIKGRIAAFVPVNSRFQDIYGHCGLGYELEAARELPKNFEVWGNLNWYPDHGKSIGLHNSTGINILNFSLGPKYVFRITHRDQIYVGLGAVISGVWLNNHTHFSHRHVSKAACGGVLKLGFYHYFNDAVFIDLFTDYYYQPVHFHTHVDIGGLRAGIGVGGRF